MIHMIQNIGIDVLCIVLRDAINLLSPIDEIILV